MFWTQFGIQIGKRPEEWQYYCLNTGINQKHHHIQQTEFWGKLISEYEGMKL